MVVGRIWRFVKRHKGKLFMFTAVTAGAYMSYTYLRDKLEELRERQMAEAFDLARKQTHYESNQRTCNTTVLSLIPKMKEVIMTELNCEKMTELLQSKPSNKFHIWSELKILAFTRAILSIYCTCVLTLTLRVQLNVVGGVMYTKSRGGDAVSAADSQLYDKYLSTIQVFLRQGVRRLCQTVQHSVERELLNCSLKIKMTPEMLRRTVESVRRSVEGTEQGGSSTFTECMLSDMESASRELSEDTQGLLCEILADTREILLSSDYAAVLHDCFQYGFDALLTSINQTYTSARDDSLALAKLIPPLVCSIHVVCPDAADKYLEELFTLGCLQDFSQQIYAAYSKPAREATDTSS